MTRKPKRTSIKRIRAQSAWALAYEAKEAEARRLAPTITSMAGLGDRKLPGFRQKFFEVRTTLHYRNKKPTTIITMSDGR